MWFIGFSLLHSDMGKATAPHGAAASNYYDAKNMYK